MFVWRGPHDVGRLAELVAEKTVTELFSKDGNLVRLESGQFVPVNYDDLQETIAKYVVSIRLVDRNSFGWQVEYFDFSFPVQPDASQEPTRRTLVDLIGLLTDLVVAGPKTPSVLSEQKQREVRERLKVGEPAHLIAAYYKVDLDTIEQLRSGRNR